MNDTNNTKSISRQSLRLKLGTLQYSCYFNIVLNSYNKFKSNIPGTPEARLEKDGILTNAAAKNHYYMIPFPVTFLFVLCYN